MSIELEPSVADVTGDVAAAEQRFRGRIARLNLRGARVAAILAALAFPMFSVLDWFVLHPVFWELFWLRLTVVAWMITVVILSFRSLAERHFFGLSASVFLAAGLCIDVMVHLHDWLDPSGSPSHYYAGLILVVVGAATLGYWTLRQSVLVLGTIYLSYLLPTVFFQFPDNFALYLSNNFFLLATMVIAAAGQFFTYQLQRRESIASQGLENAISRLGEANQKLTDLDRYKTQFFANITHELKTPLTLILAPTESVLKGELGTYTPDQQEFLRRIYRNGLRLMKLVSDLLDLAKLEDSKLRL
ncbi:MAG: hypothetical protein FJ098_10605, partial [Deltaproteobacteria bacterium]|nr:hypothetical protein [Deltaproteobacteria bacterium]